MSGVLKKVGKIAFAPVLLLPKKWRKPVLLAAAVVLTAGTALAAAGVAVPGLLTAGGAASAVTGALGLSGTVGSVLTGALTYTAIGATAGAAINAAQGKNIYSGATTGAMLGAAAGGLAGGFGVTLPGMPAPQTALSAGMPAAQLAAAAPESLALPGMTPAASSAGSTLGAAPVVKGFGATAQPSFWNTMAGGATIAGVGQGVAGYAAAKEQSSAEKKAAAARAANYAGTGDNLMKPSDLVNIGGAQPSAATKWGTPGLNYRYAYDADSGSIIKVPA